LSWYTASRRGRAELAASLKNLDRRCEQAISEIRKIPGCDADREEPAALGALYPRALVGEADPRKTGREIIETAHSLAPLIPTESEWEGAPRPHTLFSLPTGKLIGVDLFDRQLIPSPLVLALAAPRGGKSVLLGRIINDALATKARACVRAVDFGESFKPLVDVLGGRQLRFQPGTDRTINASGALKAAEIMRSSGMKAVRLDQMSQIVSTLSRDLARRTEMAMTLRY
jgi:hypothetical protein